MDKTRIKIERSQTATLTSKGTRDVEEWGTRDCHSYDNHVHWIAYTSDKYCELETFFDVEPDTDYYLLYYTYTTGDSFGHDSGLFEAVDLYKTWDEANKNRIRIQSAKSPNVCLDSGTGKAYDCYISCIDDFFGHLDDVFVERVRITR